MKISWWLNPGIHITARMQLDSDERFCRYESVEEELWEWSPWVNLVGAERTRGPASMTRASRGWTESRPVTVRELNEASLAEVLPYGGSLSSLARGTGPSVLGLWLELTARDRCYLLALSRRLEGRCLRALEKPTVPVPRRPPINGAGVMTLLVSRRPGLGAQTSIGSLRNRAVSTLSQGEP
jgi:hypothetical protein